jgi:hypothetical protein
MSDNPHDLEFGSEECESILELFNRTRAQPDAQVGFDAMAGAYSFSDEFPELDNEDDRLFPLVGLFRVLCAYRLSLVRGNPRMEWSRWWELAKSTAPNWAGFTEDRCSDKAMPHAQWSELKSLEFDKGMEELERRYENWVANGKKGPIL